jgi:hypothetical protein
MVLSLVIFLENPSEFHTLSRAEDNLAGVDWEHTWRLTKLLACETLLGAGETRRQIFAIRQIGIQLVLAVSKESSWNLANPGLGLVFMMTFFRI